MIKVGILILSLLPFSALCSQTLSSGDLLKACNGSLMSVDEEKQGEADKIYKRLKHAEQVACLERDDKYRDYLIKKYTSSSGFFLGR